MQHVVAVIRRDRRVFFLDYYVTFDLEVGEEEDGVSKGVGEVKAGEVRWAMG